MRCHSMSSNAIEMCVSKRNGHLEGISFDKILSRIRKLGQEANIRINYQSLVMKVIDQLYHNIPTTKIDELAADQCAILSTNHIDYAILAARIIVSNHQKNTEPLFSLVMQKLYDFVDIHGKNQPKLSSNFIEFVQKYENELNSMVVHDRDYLFDYFGFKTLERTYLFKTDKNTVAERPQHMWLRVAVGIHGNINDPNALDLVKETYDLMSQKYFTHATPTLFNAGTPRPQMSSCYLLSMEDDSIDGIFNTLKDCAQISKWAGGIGLHIHNVRAKGTHINGTNGTSNGIVPMLRVFNNTARYVDQCIMPETMIYTDKGPIEIQHCISNTTRIFNTTGLSEVIENVLEHPYDGIMYHITTPNCIDPLQITPEHPIYVYNNTNGLFKWIETKDLTYDDWMVHAIPKYDINITHLNENDCLMYGLILGFGEMNNKEQAGGHLLFHSTEHGDLIDFCVEYFKSKCVLYETVLNGDKTKLTWHKSLNMPFRFSDIFNMNKEKHIAVKWLNLPISKSKYILKGLLNTDTCFKEDNFTFVSQSRVLIESIIFICLKFGILSSGQLMTTNNYILNVPKTKEICELMGNIKQSSNISFKRINDYLLSNIVDIKKTHYSGTLYDLQMKKEHNYMLHNGIVHNGGGKRNGSFAIYLETWHADIEDFLEMKKNHGDEELKGRDLFYALWVSDLFMERVKNNGKWSLMCPHECVGLSDVHGKEFVALYEKYESEGKFRKTVLARDLWFKILDAQMETGTPYLMYKDAANAKSNQQNLGTIKSSNLCTEIIEYSDDKETAVCNLASIGLPSFVDETTKEFDYEKLHAVVKVITNNLNKVIDVNFYPTEKTKRSNLRHRPIGLGVQGLADTFVMMNVPFCSEEASKINLLIFETIYHASLESSNEIALKRKNEIIMKSRPQFDLSEYVNEWEYDAFMKNGNYMDNPFLGSYSSIEGSPVSQGILQFDLWGKAPPSNRYNWDLLKNSIKLHGIRNSLLVAPMPTASTSQILGFNECFEPFTSNIYSRRTLAGEFVVVNKYLMKELIDLGFWNDQIKNNIIANKGSIQHLTMIPEHIRNKYKIVWEIPMRHLIDMSADRGAFICQSQSLNLWVEDPTYNTLTSMHFYSWKKGLKTGIYYLRRKAKHQAQQFTIEPTEKEDTNETADDEICEMCSA